jgi:dGTPase
VARTNRLAATPVVEGIVEAVVPAGALRDTRLSGHAAKKQSQRLEGNRDADRILYSPAWRRLGGVTQVVTPFEDSVTLHNRLTHSEKVGQVARAIALALLGDESTHQIISDLGGLSAGVCQAAGLAHDIGHPPFGHIGEEVLDELARDELGLESGFEGNAQTVRILTTRRVRSALYEGLDLTYATLAAVLKYPWERAQKLPSAGRINEHEQALKGSSAENRIYAKHWRKFNVYDSERVVLETVRSFLPATFVNDAQSLEASVMDIADDISYAVHDLEDFYLAGTLNIARVIQDLETRADNPNKSDPLNPFYGLFETLERDYTGWADEIMFSEAIDVTRTLFSFVAEVSAEVDARVRARLSDQISSMIASVNIQNEPQWPTGPYVALGRPQWHVVQVLKEITKRYVISGPDVALLQIGQRTILEELVDMLSTWGNKDRVRLPRTLREELDIAESITEDDIGYGPRKHARRGLPNRAYLDYLCTLTDAQCISLHDKLSGRRPHRSVAATGY